jgi:asparagine synthase (glutamine-hydrolysing)
MTYGNTHALVFNGEIFNHHALRMEMERTGERFVSRCDTEVVLRGLVRHGLSFLEKLRGPFALALLHKPSGELWLARDRLGVNPLYTARVPGGGTAFSSTVAALQAAALTGGRLSVRGLCGFLFYGSVPEPLTLVEGVEELAPGSWMRVKPNGHVDRAVWWRLPAEDPGIVSFEEAAERTRAALVDAVRAEQVSDVPVALLLSSGLDSTAVAALVSTTAARTVDAFTVSFASQGPAVDESLLARETADALGLRHHRVVAHVEQCALAVQQALMAQDLPSMDGINTYFVSSAIRGAGFKVALSGLGGDELFLGYLNRANFRRLAHLPDLRGMARLARGIHRAVRGRGLSMKLERALHAVLQPRGRAGAYAAVRTLMGPGTVLRMIHPDLMAQLNSEDVDPVSYLDVGSLPADTDGALSRLELRNYLRSTLLKDSNILSLAHGLELRVPLMDYQLVETLLRIRGTVRAQGTPPKPLLRAALRSLLPEGVERRPKVGFVLPLRSWLAAAQAQGMLPRSEGLLQPDHQAPFPASLACAALDAYGVRSTGSGGAGAASRSPA